MRRMEVKSMRKGKSRWLVCLFLTLVLVFQNVSVAAGETGSVPEEAFLEEEDGAQLQEEAEIEEEEIPEDQQEETATEAAEEEIVQEEKEITEVSAEESPEILSVQEEQVPSAQEEEGTEKQEKESSASIEEQADDFMNREIVRVNPLYSDIYDENDFFQDDTSYQLPKSATSSSSYMGLPQAVKAMRSHMKNRDTNFVMNLRVKVRNGDLQKTWDEFFKAFWDEVFAHTGNPKEGDYLKLGWAAEKSATLDHYMSKGWSYWKLQFQVKYYASRTQEEAVDRAVNDLKSRYKLTSIRKTDYDKIKDIYDYICSTVTYDHANLHNNSYKLKYSAYAALIKKTAVCQGYALLFYRLALESGIDCRVVGGKNHAYNIVRLGNYYYNLDSTWDAGRMENYKYFLLNDVNMADNPAHVRESPYNSRAFYAAYKMDPYNFDKENACRLHGHEYGRKQRVLKAATCTSDGKKWGCCSVCGTEKEWTVPAYGHSYSSWKTVSKATIYAPLKQRRSCSRCKAVWNRTSGKPLKKKISANANSLILKTGQKTSVFRIKFAAGDKVVSWKTSNKNILRVSGRSDGKCTLTALNRTGKVRLTVTLKSGLQKKIWVKVQTQPVSVSKVTIPVKTVSIKKGKTYTLRPSKVPITGKERITFTSSNKKIAAVNSKGLIKGVRRGTARITVKAGGKTVTCKVVVK